MLNTNNKISEKFSLKASAHLRYFEIFRFYQQEIYRVGLSYNKSKNFNITLGMVFSTKKNFKLAPNNYEYRYYSDFNWKTFTKKLDIKPRIRIENSLNSMSDFEKFDSRIRFGLTFNYPILKKTDLYFFDEIFFNFSEKKFGENRIGFGFTNKISEVLKFQLGFLNIYQTDIAINRLQLGILLNTDFIDLF